MTDGSLPDRLTQLRSRWEADPASRIFLQLAEEYRHQGRLHDALGVLDEGLKEHPGYLSALVAKGRCLLELGQPEPARDVLERVVRQDATQMVANKLLVRAYLDTGQAVKAGERLDLYSLLHDGDPEVEELRHRIQRLAGSRGDSGPRPPEPHPDPDPRPAVSTMPITPSLPGDDVFDLGAPVAAPRREAQDVFDLPSAAPARPSAAAPAPPAAELEAWPAELEADPLAAAAPPSVPASIDDEPEPVAEGEPFPGLVSRALRRRYYEALAAEGIFAIELPAALARIAAPPAAPATPPQPTPQPALDQAVAPAPDDLVDFPLPAPAPAPEPAELAAAGAAEAAGEEPVDRPPVPWAVEGTVETVTLGELYLRQGHLGEAERIFHEVLAREPGNAAARDGLARAGAQREGAVSASAAPGAAAGPSAEPELSAAPPDRRSRTIQMLHGYLDRIRRGDARHVS